MSDQYYKARIGELERELEAANAENVRLSGKSGCCIECERLARENESLTAIVNQYDYAEECQDEQKLWELYSGAAIITIEKNAANASGALALSMQALAVWEAGAGEILEKKE